MPKPAAPSGAASHASTPQLLAPTPGSLEFTVESSAMTVTNLAFTGTSTVTSGNVTLPVLTFTADSVALLGLTEREPCFAVGAGSEQLVHSIPGTATATLGGPVTLVATSFSYTVGGITTTYDNTNVPPVGTLLASGTLPAVQLTATRLSAASLSGPNLSMQLSAC